MSTADTIASVLIEGGRAIAERTSNTTDDKAIAVLAGVRAIVAVMEAGVAKSLTPADCHAAFAELRDQLAANDAAADARLHEKFDRSDR
jgi:hypothetical protein